MTRKHMFPAGSYWIGDPCYVVKDENWGKLLDETACFGLPEVGKPTGYFDDGLFHYNGETCFAQSTAYGDGTYALKDRNGVVEGTIPVDAGLISIMPIYARDEMGSGVILSFDAPFGVWERNGVFHFGSYKVNTNY